MMTPLPHATRRFHRHRPSTLFAVPSSGPSTSLGFTSYVAESTRGGDTRLSAPVTLSFSGASGLVSGWVIAHPVEAARPWQLTADEWMSLAGTITDVEKRCVILEQKDDHGAPRYARLLAVQGVCEGSRTEMMFSLEPLIVVNGGNSSGSGLIVRPEATRRLWSEELALEGSPWGRNASWHWCSPKLAIGSATVGFFR